MRFCHGCHEIVTVTPCHLNAVIDSITLYTTSIKSCHGVHGVFETHTEMTEKKSKVFFSYIYMIPLKHRDSRDTVLLTLKNILTKALNGFECHGVIPTAYVTAVTPQGAVTWG